EQVAAETRDGRDLRSSRNRIHARTGDGEFLKLDEVCFVVRLGNFERVQRERGVGDRRDAIRRAQLEGISRTQIHHAVLHHETNEIFVERRVFVQREILQREVAV